MSTEGVKLSGAGIKLRCNCKWIDSLEKPGYTRGRRCNIRKRMNLSGKRTEILPISNDKKSIQMELP